MAELYGNKIFANTNLKLYYRFNERSGTTLTDSSGNSNTGTASRSNILNNPEGVFNYKGVFVAASSDIVTITDTSALKPTGNVTFGCWIKTGTNGSRIFQSYSQNPTIAGVVLQIGGASGFVDFFIGRNTGAVAGTDYASATGTTVIIDNVWRHICGTFDGATIKCYVNGVLDGQTSFAFAGAGFAATNYVRVGGGSNSGAGIQFVDGSIDDLFMLNGTALTANEVLSLYNRGTRLNNYQSVKVDDGLSVGERIR